MLHFEHGLSTGLRFTLAICGGAAIANLYYSQPLLALIGASFDAPASVAAVAVATQLGYALGILFVLPLGDQVDRRHLTFGLVAILILANLACAAAPSLHLLVLAAGLVGFGATIGQVMVPLAADLAKEEQRGRALGTVVGGIFAGILLARTVSGAIGAAFGWRTTFAVAALVAVALAVVLARAIPKLPLKPRRPYGELLGSMVQLLMRHPELRLACATQACVFGIFSAFWAVLALRLAEPPFGMGPAVAGAFGAVGVVGIVAANMSGRAMQRFGSRKGLLAGLCCCLAAYGVFAIDVSLIGLIVGVALLDFGMAIANVANQSLILGLDSAARSRMNTVYVTSAFLGGALGSATASAAWAHGGWFAVCLLGLGTAVLALSIVVAHRPTQPQSMQAI